MSRYRSLPSSLAQHIAGSAAASLLAHAERLNRLAETYSASVPEHLGAASHVANFKSGCVIIHADNGAVATKLRQLAPRLGLAFSEKGIECSEVRIKVQAVETSAPQAPHMPRTITRQARESLVKFSESLPESSLRSALQRLVERAATPPGEASDDGPA